MKPTKEELQLDALREVANVGAGHAARALSELTGGQRMGMDIPRALRVDVPGLAEMLGGESARVTAASFDMTGAMTGRLLVVWPQADAERLGKWLVERLKSQHGALMMTSALKEAANIVASACLSAVGQLAGLTLLPSVPMLSESTAGEIARGVLARVAGPDMKGLVLEAKLHSPEMSNELLIVPDAAGAEALLKNLGL